MSKIYLSPSNQTGNITALGSNECEEMNRITDYLVPELTRHGIEVKRAARLEALAERVKECDEWKGDYYIALHSNAGGGRGCEVYICCKGGRAEALAGKVYSSLSAITPTADRGVKVEGFYEIKTVAAPAILAEVEFHDCKEGAEWIASNYKNIAVAVAKGILAQLGIAYRPQSDYEAEKEEAVRKAVEKGILKGNSSGDLMLNDYVTRGDLMVILDRAGAL